MPAKSSISRFVHGLAAHVALATLPLGGMSCSRAPEPTRYEIRGQILGVRADVGEVRLKHEAIPGYMDAMTMSFSVKERRLLADRAPGDLVRGTLVVTETDAWIEGLEKTGFAEVVEEPDDESGPAPAFTLLEAGAEVPGTALVDQQGRPWTFSAVRGKVAALTFIYTRCPLPTYCPLMDRNFRAVQRALASRPAAAGRFQLVTVSFDPAFDTPEVLRRHAASLGADLSSWTFLTGERESVESFAAQFGVSVMRDPTDPVAIEHNLRTAVIDPSGRLVKIYSGSDWTPDQLARDLEGALPR